MRKAFTLLEILIVTIIIGLLAAIMLQTYVTMTRIAFRVQQEKDMTEQLVYISQFLQNLADRNTIDYDRYDAELGSNYLIDQQGRTNTLFLSGQDGLIALTLPTHCSKQSIAQSGAQDCFLILSQSGQNILIHSNTIPLVSLHFVISPAATQDAYLADPSLCSSNFIACLRAPGFRVFATLISPLATDEPLTMPIQQFFNL